MEARASMLKTLPWLVLACLFFGAACSRLPSESFSAETPFPKEALASSPDAVKPAVAIAPRHRALMYRNSLHRVNAARVRSNDPDWQLAEKEVYVQPDHLKGLMAKLDRTSIGAFVLPGGSHRRKTISLTFDDGPHPAYTTQLLKILDQEKVKATFFVVGFMAERYPDMVRQIRAHGHEIGNHTYSHVTLTKLPLEGVLTEYKAANVVISSLTGERVRYCRPPGGDLNREVIDAAADLGLTTVLWGDDPGDYADPGDRVLYRREVARLKNGAIVLLHDGSKNTVDTLAKFIETARKAGYEFVTLDELRKPAATSTAVAVEDVPVRGRLQ